LAVAETAVMAAGLMIHGGQLKDILRARQADLIAASRVD
jgi:hypothetical protein